ncbi:UNVERIFIED_CONTAM: yidC, partial [Trichonephila clavipes]
MNYGIVILILTLFLKLIMFPLTYKSYQSMGKMRVLKPQLDEIKAKVGDDNPMLLQQEQMKLYKQAGVNPLGGCLPLLLQMPFTLAFFFFFPNLFELRGESFLWVKDLSTYDAPITFPSLFGFIDHISLMCVLMTITTLLTTWYNNATTAGANNQMKYIGYFMPLIFFFVLNSFPAGLNYYYFLSAVLTFLTQVLIRQFVNDDKILAKIEEKKKKPASDKKSSFQTKMEEMMQGLNNANLKSTFMTEDGYVKTYQATAELPLATAADSQYGFSFFFGPNKYKTLKAEGNGFDKIINMGWGPMSWINKFITVPIFDFLDGFNMNYGI